MPIPASIPPEKKKALEQRLINNPWTSKTLLSKELGLNLAFVYRTYKRMVDRGEVPMRRRLSSTRPRKGPSVPQDRKTGGGLILESSLPTDPAARRSVLDQIIHSGDDSVRVRAISLREDLERFSGSQSGPPPPSTLQEAIERLGRIMQAAEPTLVDAALEWVASKKQEALRAKETASPASAESPASGNNVD